MFGLGVFLFLGLCGVENNLLADCWMSRPSEPQKVQLLPASNDQNLWMVLGRVT